jgi:hypothetical protein
VGSATRRTYIIALSVGLLTLGGLLGAAALAPAPAAAAPTAEEIELLLAENGSPMQGLGPVFLAEGLEHGVDPAFLVAVAGAESSFGRFLYAPGGDECTYNAFNWFYAPRRQDSDFGSWEEAIARVAEGIAGRLYYGSGLVSVAAIGPRYCPEGTGVWLNNVTMFMLRLRGDPADTRYWRDGPPSTEPGLLVLQGRTRLDPGPYEVGREARAVFTIVNEGDAGVTLRGVRLVVHGPLGMRHDLGTRAPFTIGPGEARRFVASWSLRLPGRWGGWIEVDSETQASLVGSAEAFVLECELPRDPELRRFIVRELELAPRR